MVVFLKILLVLALLAALFMLGLKNIELDLSLNMFPVLLCPDEAPEIAVLLL